MNTAAPAPQSPEMQARLAVEQAVLALVTAIEACQAADYCAQPVIDPLTSARRTAAEVLLIVEGKA